MTGIRTAAVGCLLAAVAVRTGASAPLDPGQLKARGYVSDFAGVLDPVSQAQLDRFCGQVAKSTGSQMAVVTVPSLNGAPIEDFAADLFRKWGIGKKGEDDGVLLLLVVRDRKDRIEVGYGLEAILPDGFTGSVLREMAPSLREGNYAQALTAGTAEIGDQIAKAKGVTINRTLPRRGPPPGDTGGGSGVPWPFIILGLLILFGMFGRGGGGGFLTWMLLGNLFGSSRYRDGGSNWGGGGFGGHDGGGGGFGGFGGGGSGGGGASGSW